jgi:hypothetical protein
MGNFVFGDVLEIVCNHNGNTYRYAPKANETFNVDRGGIRANDDANQVTSNGQMMSQLNRVRWSIDGPIAYDQITGAEESSLNLMSASPIMGIWQFSFISGAILKGEGRPVGDIASDSNAGTLTLKVAGSRELEKI